MAGESESQPTRAQFDPKTLGFTERAQINLSLPESEKRGPKIEIIAQVCGPLSIAFGLSHADFV